MPRELLQCRRPRSARAQFQCLLKALPRSATSVDRATVQITLIARRLTQCSVKVELQQRRDKIAVVRNAIGDMVEHSAIEILLCPCGRRYQPLVLPYLSPPAFVVMIRR